MALRTGSLPDRYAAPEPIGQGGMGEIYRATDTMLDRTVAVKMLARRHAQDKDVRERFTREAFAVARLSGDPYIVTIYDVGEWEEQPFIVMEYLPGGSLEHVLRAEGAQPPRRVLDWLEQAATALDGAHRKGVVHRDVKPANLLLDALGNVNVVDFGIASALGHASLTQTGTVLGTAAYLSPEQAQGGRTTPASDGYALAVVAFELLGGRRPFEADSVAAEATAHVTAEVPSVCEVNPSLPCELDPVFAKALAKDPTQRYASCAEFVAALRASFEHAAAPTAVLAPPGHPPMATRHARRTPWLWPLAGLLLLAAVGGGIAGALLAGGHSAALPAQRPSVSVKTVTQQGTTVVQTVAAAPPSAPTTSPATTAPAGADPHALNDQAWSLMKQGNYRAALPLLEQAVQGLQGQTSDIYDGYANYNLGVVLIQLGRCPEALPYLETAKHIEPDRHEVNDALKVARKC
jgi:tRNA A-37 threonylcarbamoyl transferase component Bud32/tetratricopeptide (TPR) repeat protein